MKLIALAAALAVAAPAIAQDVPQTSSQKAQSPTNNGASMLGGYAPTAPLFATTPEPGATVIFVPNTQTATEAFPPPPPKAAYPVCKRGQFDGCTQRGG